MYGPDTSKTFEDLLIRLAEWDGCASYSNPEDENDNRARIPENPHDLDRLKRAVNDAIEIMTRGGDIAYEWRCLMHKVQITIDPDGNRPSCVDGDTGRYRLPWYYDNASPATDWYVFTSGTTLVSYVTMTDLKTVRTYILANVGRSRPIMAAVVPGSQGSPGAAHDRGFELYVAPKPDQAYTMETVIRLRPTKLERLTDRHVFGELHDETILAIAKWCLVRDSKSVDEGTLDRAKAYMNEAMAQSVRLDLSNVPTNLGIMTDPGSARFDDRVSIADRFNVDLYGTRVI